MPKGNLWTPLGADRETVLHGNPTNQLSPMARVAEGIWFETLEAVGYGVTRIDTSCGPSFHFGERLAPEVVNQIEWLRSDITRVCERGGNAAAQGLRDTLQDRAGRIAGRLKGGCRERM